MSLDHNTGWGSVIRPSLAYYYIVFVVNNIDSVVNVLISFSLPQIAAVLACVSAYQWVSLFAFVKAWLAKGATLKYNEWRRRWRWRLDESTVWSPNYRFLKVGKWGASEAVITHTSDPSWNVISNVTICCQTVGWETVGWMGIFTTRQVEQDSWIGNFTINSASAWPSTNAALQKELS